MTPARSLLLGVTIAAAFFTQALQRSIEIWSEHPIAIEIEWLTIDEAGKHTVTARRKTAVGPPVPLEFTHAGDRFVRFSYQGASPRTYSTAELIGAKKLHVPDVLPGGELLLLVPPATVRPTELLIEGPRVKTIVLSSAVHVSLPGMPGGDYRVVPIYEGGIKGEPQAFTVKMAQTTLAPMPVEDVGAVRVRAADEVCAVATELHLNALVRADVGPQFKGALNRNRIVASKEPRCEMAFGGLKPGPFELFYFRDKAGAGNAMFDVAAQTVSAVEVAGPRVRVEGRATLNGKPIREAAMMFAPVRIDREERTPLQTEVLVDAEGFYSLALERPGRYVVMLRRPRGSGLSRETTFVDGHNIFNFAMTGGSITLNLLGLDARTTAQIRIEGTGSIRSAPARGQQKAPLVFDALPFGSYKVTVTVPAASARAPRPAPQTVILTAASPDAKLTFDLTAR